MIPAVDPWVTLVASAVAHVAIASIVTLHVLLYKESPRSAIGWTALAWLSPWVGALAYLMLGVNRVQRKAAKLRAADRQIGPTLTGAADASGDPAVARFASLEAAVRATVHAPVVDGNDVRPLRGGEEAFPAMLAAIDEARHSVAMMTFIFDGEAWGTRFVDALARAASRGVEVRVLVDGVGVWFSWPRSAVPALRRAGVRVERFLWSWNPLRMALLNLRNHRKVLVCDGAVAFTGGMNVRGSFVQEGDGARTAHDDLHVAVVGPIVRGLMELFAVDWAFTTGERLEGEAWFPALDGRGELACRVVPDGPDEDLDKAETVFLDAVACARERVVVVTPYLLPEDALRAAVAAAARRGVAVDLIVPWPSNHTAVDRAMRADVGPLLTAGVRLWGQPPPFDHSKLMVVDGGWSCVGSANWDPRSLRLNFEMLLEVYGEELAAELTALAWAKRDRSVPLDRDWHRSRSAWTRLVDGAARLLKPYL